MRRKQVAGVTSVAYRGAVAPGVRACVNPGFAAGAVRTISIEALKPLDSFERRHNSATKADETAMAQLVGFDTMDALVDATVPTDIRLAAEMDMGQWTKPLSESEFLATMKTMAAKNQV